MILRLLGLFVGDKLALPVLLGVAALAMSSLIGWHIWQVNAAWRAGEVAGKAAERIAWKNRLATANAERLKEYHSAQQAIDDITQAYRQQERQNRDERIRSAVRLKTILDNMEPEKTNETASPCNPYSQRVNGRILREVNKGRFGID